MRRKIISFFLLMCIIFNLAACSSVAINENNTAKNEISNVEQKQNKDCENKLGFATLTFGLAIVGGMIGYRIWPHEDIIMIITTLAGIDVGFYSGWFLSYLFNFTCEPYPKSTQNKKG